MKIEHKDGKIITTMSFAEAFIDDDILEKMTEEEKNKASKELIGRFNEALLYNIDE